MKVRELIGQGYLSWEKGEIITITAGTGKGKSDFIKKELYEKAKSEKEKILFFLHRSNTVNQFELELTAATKTDFITLKTYQAFQASLLSEEPLDLTEYKYIVCDEYHYFSSDSTFNKFTDIALNALLANQSKSVLILMSATNGFINSFLEEELSVQTKHYTIPISYDFVKSIEFYTKESELYNLLDYQLSNGIKTIIFMDSAKRSYEAYEKYNEHSMFVCSEGNTTYGAKMDKVKRDMLLKSQKFDDLFLFTTQTLDAGLNIVDDELDCIVADIADTDTLIQCIGRKRLVNDEDKVKLLIRNRTKAMLGEDSKKVKKKLKHATYLKEQGLQDYAKKFYRESDESQVVYYELNKEGYFELKVNELAYSQLIYKQNIIESIKETPNGYQQYIEELFGKSNTLLHDRYLDSQASQLLSDYCNKEIRIEKKASKLEFAASLNLRRGKDFAKTIKTINSELEKKQTPYRLVEIDSRTKGAGDKKAWLVKALVLQPNGSYLLM
ncbi:hypothetical protein [Sporosarcina sp.]|uniref:DEAD/DEAH box helicase family protein n=1 Tax=Sporosarcina sp. TaxID=49982 RepID=UPI0026069181|nr:hypothetical protein [Sporosarcina sp.]